MMTNISLILKIILFSKEDFFITPANLKFYILNANLFHKPNLLLHLNELYFLFIYLNTLPKLSRKTFLRMFLHFLNLLSNNNNPYKTHLLIKKNYKKIPILTNNLTQKTNNILLEIPPKTLTGLNSIQLQMR